MCLSGVILQLQRKFYMPHVLPIKCYRSHEAMIRATGDLLTSTHSSTLHALIYHINRLQLNALRNHILTPHRKLILNIRLHLSIQSILF